MRSHTQMEKFEEKFRRYKVSSLYCKYTLEKNGVWLPCDVVRRCQTPMIFIRDLSFVNSVIDAHYVYEYTKKSMVYGLFQ